VIRNKSIRRQPTRFDEDIVNLLPEAPAKKRGALKRKSDSIRGQKNSKRNKLDFVPKSFASSSLLPNISGEQI
jgi:hypothetical protein